MPLTAAEIEQQKKQAEELLFAGPQTLGFRRVWIKCDLYRNALYDLGVVTSGIIGRQQSELRSGRAAHAVECA